MGESDVGGERDVGVVGERERESRESEWKGIVLCL
jgi:hypothetical protein